MAIQVGDAPAHEQVRARRHRTEPLSALSLAALGVVFGDIGTSPLYAFQQCFTGDFPAAVTPQNVLGILSLIFWALVVIVCVKYVGFLLRADYDGQGGTLALLAQLIPPKRAAMPMGLGALALLVLFGSSMLYGDGAITPAISVISAIEGLDVWTKAARPFIVPLSVIVLAGLFAMQKRGTGRIGNLFGPIMLLWFSAIGVLGGFSIARHPQVLAALNPLYAVEFIIRNGLLSLLIFGAVVLCLTGAEALYADLAHFGRKPITLAWFAAVFPALLLNYFGQGALTLANPHVIAASPFFTLVPRWGLIPMVFLATVATVIASQALISGVFSLTQQAMQLGYTPRFPIIHTSRHFAGQIYMPTINAMLGVVCIILIVTFRSSERLGGAYGLAVTITMLTTTIAFSQLLRKRWKWPAWQWVPLIALFLAWEISFLIGNASKFISGGWVPFAMALALFTLFTTWNRGRRRMMTALTKHAMPVDQFLREVKAPTVVSGTAFFLSPDPHGIPFVLHHQWMRSHIIFDTIILLTVMHASQPFVHPEKRLEIEEITPRLLRVKAWYGFMQEARIHDILHHLRKARPGTDFSHPTYYLASPKIREASDHGALPSWQRNLFQWMTRNARPLTDSLGLPPNNVIEFGVEVKI
ncbi:MAG TPA: KUP/HAK/KT family potassium transporter [Candidatus Baltobacteraceae bacterium]|nr:KUP/HAK/KT family potassium transporter [Candidatus Baltobacteraceae bacterium]